MNCSQISSLPYNCQFGRGSAERMKNGSLNFGVVTPPNMLPTTTLYETVYSNEYLDPNAKPIVEDNKNASKAGKFSAGCTLAVMALTALSLLPFIRKH